MSEEPGSVVSNNFKLVSAGEIAKELSVPASYIKAEAEAGRLPHIKTGRSYRFNPQAVAMAIQRESAGLFANKLYGGLEAVPVPVESESERNPLVGSFT